MGADDLGSIRGDCNVRVLKSGRGGRSVGDPLAYRYIYTAEKGGGGEGRWGRMTSGGRGMSKVYSALHIASIYIR